MKQFSLVFSLFLSINSINAQCPCAIKNLWLNWQSKSIALKWTCAETPQSGVFEIYRSCISPKKEAEKKIAEVNLTGTHEFADEHLKTENIYQYRVKLVQNKCTCEATKRTNARANDDDFYSEKTENIQDFKQVDLVELTPQTASIKPNNYLKTRIIFKNAKDLSQTNFKYFILLGDKMIPTTAEFNDDFDFRIANIFIPENGGGAKEFKIAIVSGKEIIGVSAVVFID
jgi:hypothetical protein